MKASKLLIIFIVISSFSSCKPKQEGDIPDNVIKIEKMSVIMIDIHLADSRLSLDQVKGEELGGLSEQLYDRVFEKHEVTREEFYRSFKYYQSKPEIFKQVYEETVEGLSKLEAESNQ